MIPIKAKSNLVSRPFKFVNEIWKLKRIKILVWDDCSYLLCRYNSTIFGDVRLSEYLPTDVRSKIVKENYH
jgi:hypothetical protein